MANLGRHRKVTSIAQIMASSPVSGLGHLSMALGQGTSKVASCPLDRQPRYYVDRIHALQAALGITEKIPGAETPTWYCARIRALTDLYNKKQAAKAAKAAAKLTTGFTVSPTCPPGQFWSTGLKKCLSRATTGGGSTVSNGSAVAQTTDQPSDISQAAEPSPADVLDKEIPVTEEPPVNGGKVVWYKRPIVWAIGGGVLLVGLLMGRRGTPVSGLAGVRSRRRGKGRRKSRKARARSFGNLSLAGGSTAHKRRFGAAGKACYAEGHKPGSKSFGKCMKRRLGTG